MTDPTPVLDGAAVIATAGRCAQFLEAHLPPGPGEPPHWAATVPEMTMTVAEITAHAADAVLWYAIDLAAAGIDLDAVEHRVDPAAEPAAIVAAIPAYARVLAATVDAADPETRGVHPMGAADAEGFAAMACDELLIHTDDAARGLGATFTPSEPLAAAVLARLFPWVGADVSAAVGPWQALRWANGRRALDDRPQLDGWAWHCAPLADWDGTIPRHPNTTA